MKSFRNRPFGPKRRYSDDFADLIGREEKKNHMADTVREWAPLIAGAMLFFGGWGLKAFIGAYNLASVPYVDAKAEESRRYTDTQAAQTLAKALDHSDMNRQLLMGEIKTQTGDIKAQGAKIDLMLDSMRQMQNTQVIQLDRSSSREK